MFTFTERHYILGTWVALHDERRPVQEREDWLGIVFRESGDPAWRLIARTCRHASADLSADAPLDHKQWIRGTFLPSVTEAEVITRMDALMGEMAQSMNSPTERVLIRGNAAKAFRRLQAKLWFHVTGCEAEV